MKPTTEPTSRGKVRSSSPELSRYIFSTFFTSWRKHTNKKLEYVQVANTAEGERGRFKSRFQLLLQLDPPAAAAAAAAAGAYQ